MVPGHRARSNTTLRDEQKRVATFVLIPELDMAGARGSAVAALESVSGGWRQSVEDRIAGSTSLQLEETVDAEHRQHAVPQPPGGVAARDR